MKEIKHLAIEGVRGDGDRKGRIAGIKEMGNVQKLY